MMPSLKPLIVGIDPGKSTGVAVIQRAAAGKPERVVMWCTKTFATVIPFLDTVFEDKSLVKVFVEHPGKFMYARNETEAGHVRDRKQQMMAANRQEAKLLFEILNAAGWDVELVAPVREKKWDAKRFKLFTGSGNRANQHEMDAVRLAKHYLDKR